MFTCDGAHPGFDMSVSGIHMRAIPKGEDREELMRTVFIRVHGCIGDAPAHGAGIGDQPRIIELLHKNPVSLDEAGLILIGAQIEGR